MDLLAALVRLRSRRWVGYGAALGGAAFGIGIRLALGPALEGFPFITFFPGVLLASASGGRAPGLMAVLAALPLAAYYLIPPYGSLAIAGPSGWFGILAFLLVAGAIVLLIDQAMTAAARLAATTRALQAANARLEAAAAERLRDLTEAQAALREERRANALAQAQLQQLQKMETVGQLTGGIAHDFNNMLAIITGSVEAARRRLQQGRDGVDRQLDHAMEGARRAAALTRKLLAFSRRQPLAPVVLDANALIAGMADMLRRTLGETIALRCVPGDGLWPCHVDPCQAENMLLNLAVNARDAMPDGGRLTIGTRNATLGAADTARDPGLVAGEYVLVTVADSGTGMAPEVVAHAFDPFFTTKPEGRGTGLGLSQVQAFVRQSRGHVRIRSAPGQGTTVEVYLPRHAGEAAPGATIGAAIGPPADHAPPPGGSELILLVEDDPAVRQVHAGMLRDLGYAVRDAADAEAALALLPSLPALRLIFTDMVMPGMGGRALAAEARRLRPGLRVLYTTGYTPNGGIEVGGVEAGGVEVGAALLTKPFAYDQLARALRAALDPG